MKRIFIMIAAFGIMTASFAQTYKADKSASSVKWHAEKVTGEHTGFVNIKEGNLVVENGKITGGSFVIDMTSITNTDIESEEYNAKLVGHLKSDDFFGVETYPVATFNIKSVKEVESEEASHHFTGDITIKNKTMEMTIPAQVNVSGDKITATSSFDIDRSKFDVRYRSASFFSDLGDNLIYDDFNISVNLVTRK